MANQHTYQRFSDFYPYYLTEHANGVNRLLHFVGTGLVIACLCYALISGHFLWLIAIPFLGYGFAWVGHFFIEKNRPATFTYPWFSLASDFVMFWHILTGQINQRLRDAQQRIASSTTKHN